LAHMNRSATAGQLSASIAHEILQPLAAIAANGSAGLRWLARTTPDLVNVKSCLELVVAGAHRGSEIINTIRSMYKKSEQEREPVNLAALIDEVLLLLRGDFHQRSILVKIDLSEGTAPVIANHVQLQQVILNLLVKRS
jgi:C4-dicarboxylate-specific signal transduction histidine kinase